MSPGKPGRPRTGKRVCVKTYFNESTWPTVAKMAEEAGFRRRGLQLWVAKPHGLLGEIIANTDGVSKFFKAAVANWEFTKADRLHREAELAEREKALQEEKAKLGRSTLFALSPKSAEKIKTAEGGGVV